MPLLAHLEELRKRIIFSVLAVLVGFISCWSFADRIFRLMQQPIIGALRHHGIGGGLVYLNPTEPLNLYLEVALDSPLRPQYRSGLGGEFSPKACNPHPLVRSVALPLRIS
jgi:hypothetical protein